MVFKRSDGDIKKPNSTEANLGFIVNGKVVERRHEGKRKAYGQRLGREAAEAILYVVLVLFGAIKGMFNLKVGWSHNEKC
eukprot:scaffold18393_cov39-Cyclotella_meneghiniana.AAC.2